MFSAALPSACSLVIFVTPRQQEAEIKCRSANSLAEQGPLSKCGGGVTVIMQHEEAAGAEVAVELDEDLIGSGGHALLRRGAAELANLRGGLVGSVPDEEGG